jgi:N-hydroxyarylamine O-acetyltransferase
LLAVLTQLGFQVAPLSARVRIDRPRDYIPPRTHLFLRVELAGESYLTDVGVGALSLTQALRLDCIAPQQTPHETRRIVRDGSSLFHQALLGDTWSDVCEFTLEEMPLIDRELGNWYTSTHPDSGFRARLIATRARPDGARVTLLNRELKHRDRTGRAETIPVSSAAHRLELLDQHFGLRFSPGTQFGPPGAPWAMES